MALLYSYKRTRATMIPPAPFALPPAPAPAPSLPPASPLAVGITETFLTRDAMELARRIVAEIDQPLQLAVNMGLTEVQWNVLQHHPHFKKLLDEAKSEANSAAGIADRVRLKALMALDAGGILDMAEILASAHSGTANKIKAFAELKDISGLVRQKDQQAAQVGGGPLVTIIMPSAPAQPVEARIVSEQ
jgi:hypothetical protein